MKLTLISCLCFFSLSLRGQSQIIAVPNNMGYVTLPNGFSLWQKYDKGELYVNEQSPVYLIEVRGHQARIKHPKLSEEFLERLSKDVLLNILSNNPGMYLTEIKTTTVNSHETGVFLCEGAKLKNGDKYAIKTFEIFDSNGFIGFDFYFLVENDVMLVDEVINSVLQSIK